MRWDAILCCHYVLPIMEKQRSASLSTSPRSRACGTLASPRWPTRRPLEHHHAGSPDTQMETSRDSSPTRQGRAHGSKWETPSMPPTLRHFWPRIPLGTSPAESWWSMVASRCRQTRQVPFCMGGPGSMNFGIEDDALLGRYRCERHLAYNETIHIYIYSLYLSSARCSSHMPGLRQGK